MPPGERWAALREGDGGHEGVEDAGVLAAAGEGLEAAVEVEGVVVGQLLRRGDAELQEVARHRGADVGQVLVAAGFGDVVGLHGSTSMRSG